MCFRSAGPIIYPYLFEPIHHIHPACLSRKQKLWFHILIMVSLSWLQWVMVNMFQISHPYYSRAWEVFFSDTTLPLKLLTAAAIWETEGFSYSYIYSHCSWTEQKLTLIIQVGVGVVTALPFLFLPLLPCQVAEEWTRSKAASHCSSPSTKVASPCAALRKAHWCQLDESRSAEDARILPGVGAKLARHGCFGNPGCEMIDWGTELNWNWVDCDKNMKSLLCRLWKMWTTWSCRCPIQEWRQVLHQLQASFPGDNWNTLLSTWSSTLNLNVKTCAPKTRGLKPTGTCCRCTSQLQCRPYCTLRPPPQNRRQLRV